MELYVKNRELVVPGDKLAKGDYLIGEGTFTSGDEVFASVMGLVDTKEKFIKVIPLAGKYVPRPRDLVIGTVTDIAFSSWYLDINSPYTGVLSVANATERFVDLDQEDLSQIYDIGEVVLAKVANVSQSMMVGMTMKDRGLYKLKEGRLINISPTKVPRVIGKKGTMVSMLKDMTGCRITVGQNGRIWIQGTNEGLAIEAIRQIAKYAHTPGLTDRIKTFLEKSKKKSMPTVVKVEEMEAKRKAEIKPQAKPVVKTEKKPEKKEVSEPEPKAKQVLRKEIQNG